MSNGPIMYNGDSSTSGISSSAESYIRGNKFELYHLPEPGVEWRMTGRPNLKEHIQEMQFRGIIQQVGKERVDNGASIRNVYKTKPIAYERVQHYVEHSNPITPCGHGAFRNDPDGAFSCPVCGSEFAKEEMQL